MQATGALPAIRICRGPCGRELPIAHFRNRTADGSKRQFECRDCHRESMRQRRAIARAGVIRRFAKVGQFQKLDRRLRSVGAAVMRRLGGPDRMAQLWAQETKAAIHAGRTDRFVMNAFNSVFRLQLLDAEQRIKEHKGQASETRAEHAGLSDEQIEKHLLKQIEQFIRENPMVAVDVAASIGWTVIPPTNAQAG